MRCLVAAIGALWGCVLDVPRETWAPEVEASKVESKEIPLQARRLFDILVVVDSAPTMAGEQASIAANAPVWMDVLGQIEGGLPDLHLAVVDTDLGTMGVDVGDPRCAGSGSGGRMSTFECGVAGDFLAHERDAWGEPAQNYPGNLGATFACVATSVGATGCPWRQPLEAMRRALAQGRHNGFRRERAVLVVIFIGDGDDCSAADPALYAPASASAGPRDPFRCFARGVICDGVDDPYALGPRTGCRPRDGGVLRSVDAYRAELLAHAADPRQVVVAAVTPGGEIVVEPGPRLADGCRAGATAGTPATRIRAFASSFVDRNTVTTVCDDDWTDALIVFAELLGTIPVYSCIEGQPVDVDPAPGLQPEIGAAIVQLAPDGAVAFQQVLTACGDSLPCLRVEPDPLNCWGTPTSLGLRLEPPHLDLPGAYLQAQILVE